MFSFSPLPLPDPEREVSIAIQLVRTRRRSLCRKHVRHDFEDAIDVEDDHELAVEALYAAGELRHAGIEGRARCVKKLEPRQAFISSSSSSCFISFLISLRAL